MAKARKSDDETADDGKEAADALIFEPGTGGEYGVTGQGGRPGDAIGELRRRRPEVIEATSVASAPKPAAAPKAARPTPKAAAATTGRKEAPAKRGDLPTAHAASAQTSEPGWTPMGGGDGSREPDMVPVEGRESSALPEMVPIEGGEASASPEMVPIEGGESSAPPEMVPIEGGEASAPPEMVPIEGGEASAPPEMAPIEGGEAAVPPRMVPIEGKEASAVPEMAPIEGREASPPPGMAPKKGRTGRATAESQMVPIEGRETSASPEMVPIEAGEATSPPDMVPIEGGEASTPPELVPIKGRRRTAAGRGTGRAAAVEETTSFPIETPEATTVAHAGADAAGTGKAPRDRSRGAIAETVIRSFIDELRSTALQQDVDISIIHADNMKVEFSSPSRALTLTFAWRELDFDRIIVRETPLPSSAPGPAGGGESKEQRQGRLRKTLKKILGRRPSHDEQRVVWLRVAPIRGGRAPTFRWSDVRSSNGADAEAAKRRTAMMARFIDPHGGRDWEIELVNAGEGPDGGSTGAGRALTVSIVKRQAMMLLRGLRSAIDSEGHR